jgi:hypothetical protein
MYQHGWQLGPDVRFAVLTLPERNTGGLGGRRLELGDGYFLTSELPFDVPSHWKQWLGTLNYPAISEAGAYLMYVSPTPTLNETPLDAEALISTMRDLYVGLMVSARYFAHGAGFMLAGEMRGGEPTVKRVVGLPATFYSRGRPLVPIAESELREAVRFAHVVTGLRRDQRHDRLWRMLVTFILACQLDDSEARLHQFVRVVEGLTFSWNKTQFAARVAEFSADADTAALVELYALRGKVEHLRSPRRELKGSEAERRWRLEWHAVRAETLARYVLWLTLGSEELTTILDGDETLEALWAPANRTRRAVIFTPRVALSRATTQWEQERPTEAHTLASGDYPDEDD